MNFLLRRRKLGRTSCAKIAELSTTGIRAIRNDGAVPAGDVVFRWGCTSNVAATTIVNKAESIHLVSDKASFRKVLNDSKLCPETWFTRLDKGIRYPCIVRQRYHHQGRHLFVCKNGDDVETAWRVCGPDGYLSEFIDKVAEYRVFVVQGRVACVASKQPPADKRVAWNVAQGGKFDNVKWGDWPLRAVRVALEGFALSGLDFGGVDVMVDRDGKAYILEVNSAPSLTSPYRQACMAKCFDWIVQHGKAVIPLRKVVGGARKFIHPAIDPNALIAGE